MWVGERESKQVIHQVVMDDKKKIKQSIGSREYWGQGKVGNGFHFT